MERVTLMEIPNEPLVISVAVGALILFVLAIILARGGRNKRRF